MAPPLSIGIEMAIGGRGISPANVAPSNIILTNNLVQTDAADSAVIGYLLAVDSNYTDTHTFSEVTDTDNLFKISGDEVQVDADLSAEAGDHTYTVRATDNKGLSVDVEFTITVQTAVDPDDGGLGDGSDTDNGGFVIGPDIVDGDGEVHLSGKSGGDAVWIRSIDAPRYYHKLTAVYDWDLSGVNRGGDEIFSGFGMLDASNNFHLVGLRGDGAGGLLVQQIYGSANFNGTSNNWTVVTGSAPTNGTFSGDKRIRILINSDGTYEFQTSDSNYTTAGNWDTELTGQTPSPHSDATTYTKFGYCLFFPPGYKGTWLVTVDYWREMVFQGARTRLDGAQTVTAYALTAADYGGVIDRDTDSITGTVERLTIPASLTNRYVQHVSSAWDNTNAASGDRQLVSRVSGANYDGQVELWQGGSGDDVVRAHTATSATIRRTTGQYLDTRIAIAGTSLQDSIRNWHAVHVKGKHAQTGLLGKNADQTSVASGTEIVFQTAVHDDAGMHSSNHFVIPAALNGKYVRFTANTRSSAATAPGALLIRIGGSIVAYSFQASSSEEYMHIETMPRPVTTGQVVLLEFYTSGASETFYDDTATWFAYEVIEDFVGCYAYQNTTGQSLTGGTNADLTLDTLWYNVGGFTLSGGEIVIPAGISKVQIFASHYRPGGVAGSQEFLVRRNSSGFYGTAAGSHDSGSTIFGVCQGISGPDVNVSEGDTFTSYVYVQNTQSVPQGILNGVGVWATEHSL